MARRKPPEAPPVAAPELKIIVTAKSYVALQVPVHTGYGPVLQTTTLDKAEALDLSALIATEAAKLA